MSALFKSCVGAQCDVSVSVRVHVTATETLRRERMCANSGGGYTETTCIRSKAVMISSSEMRTDETSASSADMFPAQA